MTLVRCLTTPPQARRCHRNMPFAALLLCSQVMRPPAQQLQLLRSSTSAVSHVLSKIPHDLAENKNQTKACRQSGLAAHTIQHQPVVMCV